MQEQLRSLERDTGWRVRVMSRFDQGACPNVDDMRSACFNDKTVVMFVEASSPNYLSTSSNLLSFTWGSEVRLSRRFFNDLQSRFGDVSVMRETCEAAAVAGALDVLVACLRQEGSCAYVPGLSADQYAAVVLGSGACGAVLGLSLQLDYDPILYPNGSWVWTLAFMPAWATVFFLLLDQIVSRTDDQLPVAASLAVFAAAAVFCCPNLWFPQGARTSDLTRKERE